MYDMKWIVENENKKNDYSRSVPPSHKSLSETTEEKFNRLMRESASSLNNTRQII